MEVCRQRHAPSALPPGKTRYPLYRRLDRSQGRSGQVRIISPRTAIRSPDRPARSESVYRLSYPGPQCLRNTKTKYVGKIIHVNLGWIASRGEDCFLYTAPRGLWGPPSGLPHGYRQVLLRNWNGRGVKQYRCSWCAVFVLIFRYFVAVAVLKLSL